MPSGSNHVESHQERQFFRALRELHRRAGEPSSRAIANKVGGMSHTTVNLALKGPKVPTWPVTVKLVEALDGDVESFRQLWTDTQEPLKIVVPVDESEVQVFVSYARIDDQATYGRISNLVADIANTYESMTGKTVGVFKDVDSIRPGDDWRDRIRAGLSYSSIFLAFITPAYLRSPSCREELNEFFAFLTASSAERLVIPLIYTKRQRIEESFAEDELWIKVAKRQGPDISVLRYVNPGEPKWIETTEKLAESIDKTLSSFRHIDKPDQAKDHKPARNLDEVTAPGTLERMASIEEQVPQVVGDMSRTAELLQDLGETVTSATPRFSEVDTFAARLAASRDLAKQLDPIADELLSTADRLVSNFSEWDFFVQYLLEYGRSGGDLTDPEVTPVLKSLWTLACQGGAALAPVTQFAQIVSQGIGVSRDLDRPFMAIRAATLRIADLSGILDGWKKGLENLESEYLSEGYLDSLPDMPE